MAVASTLSVLRAHAAPLFGAALLAQLPLLLLVVAGGGEGRLYYLLSGLVGALQAGLVASGVAAALGGQRPRVGAMFAAVGARMGPLLGQSILGGLAIALGLVLLIAPGLVAWAGLFVSAPAVMSEPGLGANDALQRSWDLTRGRRLQVLLVGLIFLSGPLGVAVVAAAFGELLPPMPAGADLVVQLVSLPFFVAYLACSAVLYHRLRVEREGAASTRLGAVFE
jgi:hypothetical protein